MTRLFGALVLGVMLAGCGPKQVLRGTPTVDRVLAAEVEAYGGQAAIEKHKTLIVKGEMRIGAQGIVAPLTMWMAAPAELRTRIEIPGLGVAETGVTNGVAWASDPMHGPRLLEGGEKIQTLRNADFYVTLHAKQHYHDMVVLGRTKVGDVQVVEMKRVSGEGDEEVVQFDAATGRMIASRTVEQTMMGAVPTTSTYSDYRAIDGVLAPYLTVTKMGPATMELVFLEAQYDAPDFAMPAPPADIVPLLPAQ